MINVAVLGHGTIGSGVVEVLQTNAAVIAKRVGEDIAVYFGFERFSGRSECG